MTELRLVFLIALLAVNCLGTDQRVWAQSCQDLFNRRPVAVASIPPGISGPELIEFLKQDSELRRLFESDAGVQEKYRIDQHTAMVFEKFESQLPFLSNYRFTTLPQQVRLIETLRMTVALHDIGKPLAIANGDINRQHEFTLPILTSQMRRFGFNAAEVRLAQTLVGNDFIGATLRNRQSVSDLLRQLDGAARANGMSRQDLFQLQRFFYVIDSSSYRLLANMLYRTSEAGQLELTSQIAEDIDASVHGRRRRNLLEPLRDLVPPAQREAWAPRRFTDPTRHSSNSFRYLVHASHDPDFFRTTLVRKTLGSYSRLSMSVIDQDHTNTFSGLGVILRVPEDAIFVANHQDMNITEIRTNDRRIVPRYDHNLRFEEGYRKFGLRSPEEILQGTQHAPSFNSFGHNEVFAAGTGISGEPIQVTGFFVRVDSLGRPLVHLTRYEAAMQLAIQSGLPIIRIPPPRGFVTVRINESSVDLMNRANSRIDVLATESEFNLLVEQARREGKNLLGMSDDFILKRGAFQGMSFVRHADASTSEAEFNATNPVFRDPIRFAP